MTCERKELGGVDRRCEAPDKPTGSRCSDHARYEHIDDRRSALLAGVFDDKKISCAR